MEKTILFVCPCGMPLAAVLHGPGPGRGAEIRFRRRTEPHERIAECPNCHRDFAAVTAEDFLTNCWPGG